MGKRIVFLITAFGMLASAGSAAARPPARLPTIGVLGAASGGTDRSAAFHEGLRDLGYVEGKNVVIVSRHAHGKRALLPALAAELVRLKVDVIVTGGGNATRAAMKATSTIPIVMVQSGDPVAEGFVASLARPGGNVTGLSRISPDLNGKRLELLKEIVPGISRVAVFHTSTSASDARMLGELQDAAKLLRLDLEYEDVRGPKDFKPAFRAAKRERTGAVLVQVWGAILNSYRKEFAEDAIEDRLPAIYRQREYVQAGGLICYGVSEVDLHRRAATYVDRILRGEKPADLPVERPTKFDLVVNLRTARALGITIPRAVLLRADNVVE